MKKIDIIPVAILSSERKTETLYTTILSLKESGFSEFYIHYDQQKTGIWPGYQKLASDVIPGYLEPQLLS
jgi:hypothetical protein